MTTISSATIATLLCVLLSLPLQASEASDAQAANMMKLDRNADGYLTRDEGLGALFSLFDGNGDGRVAIEELSAFLARSGGPFQWVNPPSAEYTTPGLIHATFNSPSMDIPVGYNIYLPPGYADPANRDTRYPVIYYLHGGRPGNESTSISLAEPLHTTIVSGAIRPVIMVWVNGGRVSHYDVEGSSGESVFIEELIPHIDQTYRTLTHRGGRALQGFSQGGRGTTRIMFKHPELFVSAAPGDPGYAVEKMIFENDGIEQDPRLARPGQPAPSLDFGKGNDAFSLAHRYAHLTPSPALKVLVWVGDQGLNYDSTLAYLEYLTELGIPAERLIAEDIDHNPIEFYRSRGIELLQFHDRHWSDGS